MQTQVAVTEHVAAYTMFDAGMTPEAVKAALDSMHRPTMGYVFADDVYNTIKTVTGRILMQARLPKQFETMALNAYGTASPTYREARKAANVFLATIDDMVCERRGIKNGIAIFKGETGTTVAVEITI